MNSWKTTVCGCVAALGVYLSNQPGKAGALGQLLVGIGTLLTGLFARDNDKTSEDVKAPNSSPLRCLLPFALIGSLALAAGCATLDASADPVEVRAEQTVATAYDVFDTFLRLDNADRELVKQKAPDAHKFAEWLREPVPDGSQTVPRGVSLIQSANRVRLIYKATKSPESSARLQAALAALAAAVAETQTQLAKIR